MIEPRPSEIDTSGVPLVGTLGRCETEVAAALYIEVCKRRGDRWQPIRPREVGETLKEMTNEEPPPDIVLSLRIVMPDFFALTKCGAVTMDGEHGPVCATPLLFERLRRYTVMVCSKDRPMPKDAPDEPMWVCRDRAPVVVDGAVTGEQCSHCGRGWESEG